MSTYKRSLWSYLPRWLNYIVSHLGGYFWLPCPVCGEMQGGHEWDGRVWHIREDGVGEGCCWRHPDTREARK